MKNTARPSKTSRKEALLATAAMIRAQRIGVAAMRCTYTGLVIDMRSKAILASRRAAAAAAAK